MLTPDMKRIIEEQRLGFVATAAADGTPNVSPKGTFVVLDDVTIAFGGIRSPGTIRNLRDNARIEVNFVESDAMYVRCKSTASPATSPAAGASGRRSCIGHTTVASCRRNASPLSVAQCALSESYRDSGLVQDYLCYMDRARGVFPARRNQGVMVVAAAGALRRKYAQAVAVADINSTWLALLLVQFELRKSAGRVQRPPPAPGLAAPHTSSATTRASLTARDAPGSDGDPCPRMQIEQLGTATVGLEFNAPILLSRDDLRRHLYVIGKTGTGKSTLLYNLMLADLAAAMALRFSTRTAIWRRPSPMRRRHGASSMA